MTSKKACNILVGGQTGAGKSSLINYLIGETKAAVGVGRPVTSKDEISSYQTRLGTSKISFFDSWGIETDKAEDWKRRIRQLIAICDSRSQEEGVSWFHTVLYCIPCGNGRVQDFDLSMINFFKREGYSVVVVLTKADLANEQDIRKMANVIPLDIRPVAVSAGGTDRYGITPPFGKQKLLITIVRAAATNLPERLRHLSRSLISRWKLYTEVSLEGKSISLWDNSDLEQWINKRANQFVGELNSSLSCFIADEFSFINSMLSTPVLGKTSSIHISPPQPPEFSTWETTLTVIFSSVLIPGAILYGLFCGKADEKAKLLKMISTAAEKLQELSDNYVKEVRDQLRKEDINNIIDYKS